MGKYPDFPLLYDIPDWIYPMESLPSERSWVPKPDPNNLDIYEIAEKEEREAEREKERAKFAGMFDGDKEDFWEYFRQAVEGDENYDFRYSDPFVDRVPPLRRTSSFDKLNIDHNANEKEIKKAYYDLCKIHHPDKGGDHEMFIEITASYEECMFRCQMS
jgi:hypothetical protein